MRAGRNERRGGRTRAPGRRRAGSRNSAIGLELLEARRVLSAATGQEESALDPKTYAADRVLVKFRQPVTPPFALSATSAGTGSSGSLKSVFPTTLTSILDSFGASDARRVFPTAPRTSGLTIHSASLSNAADPGDDVPDAQSVGLDRWYSFDLAPGSDVAEVLTALAADGAVEAAEPDYLFKLSSLLDGPGGASTSGDEAGIASLPSADTDPAYGQQWHLDAVNAPAAWAHLESLGLPAGGRSDIVIAVIDTGVDYTHPDLAANMWVNTREVAGNNRDNDGNGFKNDIHGVSVVSNFASHTGNPMDDNGHGTHVAGIIAAAANNGIGGTGIAYNAKIMAIKALQYSGVGNSTDVAEAIYYAVENGADIINMSFGSYAESSLVKDALQVAFGTSVLVAAAGNDGIGNEPRSEVQKPAYPAAYNWVLGVQATARTPDSFGNSRAAFSNWDALPRNAFEYEVAAPGVGILSTLPGGSYSAWAGTSMAAPIVSGIAALLRTQFADKDTHNSRFIMGQLTVGGIDGGFHVAASEVINAFAVLTETPQPDVRYLDHQIFDSMSLSPINDGDGRLDAGETVDLAVTLKNRWGSATQVEVSIEAQAPNAVGIDPYVTVNQGTVAYGSVGAFSQTDNGVQIVGGIPAGVDRPFSITIDPSAPDGHLVTLKVVVRARDGLNPADLTIYTSEAQLTLSVSNGTTVPVHITEDTTLDSDRFWVIESPVLVDSNAKLTVASGAQVLFRKDMSLNVRGTLEIAGSAERPVRLFSEFENSFVEIVNQNASGGKTHISYAIINNPMIGRRNGENTNSSYVQTVDHVHFNGGTGWIRADSIRNSRFDPAYEIIARSEFDTNMVISRSGGAWARMWNSPLTRNSALYPATGLQTQTVVSWPEQNGNAMLTAFGARIDHLVGDSSMPHVYWGSADDTFLDNLIFDRRDTWQRNGYLSVSPALSSSSAATYPFVEDVVLTQGDSFLGSSHYATDPPQVGSGSVQVTVRFNRDMDTNSHPDVWFGPSAPFTDRVASPVGQGWQTPRTWTGTFDVSPLTGDGYQLFRIGNARAADDSWLSIGTDINRFRFEVVTTGAQSMNLRASGGEGKVDLSWTQDDFDLLAGYNIYRATSADGTYTRVNSSIIPKEQTAFTDTSVQPAQTYFYKFRIVKTDSTESVDSNVAAAAPLDTIPPVISHTALTSAVPNFAVTIRADVTDNLAVQGVTLHYRAIGETTYQTRAMTLTTGDRYTASLDAGTMTAPGVEYYISATDGVTTVYHGLAAQPHRISVVDRPVVTTVTPASGPSTGGTSVTIVGSNFKAGASVTIGGAVASNVTVVSDTQITATTPAGVPAYADVRVINADEAAGTLLGGFRYVAEGVLVSAPTLTAESGGTVEVPISVADVAGLLSATVTLTFDSTVLQPTGARTGPLTAGWAVDANTATSGQVSLALAGATSVSATGVLAIVSFDVVGDPDSSTALTLSSVSLNDGAIAAQAAAGQLAVNDLHAISGLVRYYADNTPVAGVAVFLEGEASLDVATDSLGAYSFAGLRGGDYTLMPDKQADVRQITAYDAALVLQAVTGRRSLSANETTAADVNRRDGVSALDAAYILQKSVGLIPGTFPNAGTSWVFTPAQRTYTGLAADQLNQHFTGILLGDVSGNWATEVGGAGLPGDVGIQAEPHRLSIGSALALPGETGVRVPVRIERSSPDVYAADLTITYDAGTLSLAAGGVAAGEAATGMALAVNTATPGLIRIGLAGAEPIAADGELVVLEFDVAADAASAGTVAFGAASLNEGAANVATANGTLALDPGTVVADGQETIDATVRTGGERIVKRGGGRLVLDQANSHTGGTIVEAGEVVVRNAAALGQGRLDVRPGATVVLEVGYEAVALGSLALDATGRIDLGTGRISVPAGGYDLATLRQLLTSGRNGGSWDGTTGITSRAAGANSKRAIGYVESGGVLTLGWAAYGDLNMDGRVNSTDLSLLTGGGRYNQSGSDGVWAQGDLNYDGRVNSTDISLLTSAALYNRPSYRSGTGTAPLGGSSTSLMNVATWQALGAEEPGDEEGDRAGE